MTVEEKLLPLEEPLSVGDIVEYRVGKAVAVGTIQKILTQDTELFQGFNLHCNKDNPYYLIENDHTKNLHWYHRSQIRGKLATALEQQEELGEEEEPSTETSAMLTGSQPFKVDDKVTYAIGRVQANGTIKEILTENTTFAGYNLHCSPENPHYLIQNDHTGNIHWYHRNSILLKS